MKRDREGKVIDLYTNTLEDAADFEAFYNYEPDERDCDIEEDYDEICFDEEDRCKCSDPCCPCTGNKKFSRLDF